MPLHTREQSFARSGCTPGATKEPIDIVLGWEVAAMREPLSIEMQRGIEAESLAMGV